MSGLPLIPRDITPPPKRRRLVPGQQASENLISSLSQSAPNDRQTAALSRIQNGYAISHEHLSPEFFAPAIADLDTILFNGHLSDYMLISWETMTDTPCCLSRKPTTQPPYDTSRSGSSQLRVRLAVYTSGPREQTWGGILHEMLHAYLDMTSEWHGLKQPHGPLFSEVCTAIVHRLALGGLKVHHVDQGADLTAPHPVLG